VLSWELFNTLDSPFCVAALEAALVNQRLEIFNTNQVGAGRPSRRGSSPPSAPIASATSQPWRSKA
jgi:hypothetical protein